MSEGNNWEKDVLTSIATEGLKEQKKNPPLGNLF